MSPRVVYFAADVNSLTANNVANNPRDIWIYMYCITNYVNYDINERCQWIHTAHCSVCSYRFMTSRSPYSIVHICAYILLVVGSIHKVIMFQLYMTLYMYLAVLL